jgi:hypothetical protein
MAEAVSRPVCMPDDTGHFLSPHLLLLQETVQDSRRNPQDAITPLVTGFGRPEIKHPRFVLEATDDGIPANLEQFGDLIHREELLF